MSSLVSSLYSQIDQTYHSCYKNVFHHYDMEEDELKEMANKLETWLKEASDVFPERVRALIVPFLKELGFEKEKCYLISSLGLKNNIIPEGHVFGNGHVKAFDYRGPSDFIGLLFSVEYINELSFKNKLLNQDKLIIARSIAIIDNQDANIKTMHEVYNKARRNKFIAFTVTFVALGAFSSLDFLPILIVSGISMRVSSIVTNLAIARTQNIRRDQTVERLVLEAAKTKFDAENEIVIRKEKQKSKNITSSTQVENTQDQAKAKKFDSFKTIVAKLFNNPRHFEIGIITTETNNKDFNEGSFIGKIILNITSYKDPAVLEGSRGEYADALKLCLGSVESSAITDSDAGIFRWIFRCKEFYKLDPKEEDILQAIVEIEKLDLSI